MRNFITINNRKIGTNFPPYIVAEMSANHGGDIKNAYKIIKMAKDSGADAVKMQTYTPETLTLDCDLPDFQLTEGLWAGDSLYSLYKKACTPWSWHKKLFDYAEEIGITIFSSPFDNAAVDLLESLETPAYKIASFEIIDLPLINYVAQTGKPIIISTGMASIKEIQDAVETALKKGCKELSILHCVSGYPAPAKDYNLATLSDMQQRFNLVTGLSDHTLDNTIAVASISLGASIIEKHVTLDRNGVGPDDSFSLEPKGLKDLCFSTKKAWDSLGVIDYSIKSSEQENMKFRRSLYFVKNIKKGEVVTEKHIESIRPGYGLPPKFFNEILGLVVTRDVNRGESVQFNMLHNHKVHINSDESDFTES
jgi:N-acetylneuraminate synthase